LPSLLTILSTGSDGRWHPGIGDPTPLGWVTVIAYVLAAVAAFRASGRMRAQSDGPDGQRTRARTVGRFWAGVGVVMITLGINKQLDLQTYFTEAMRDLALAEGWYEDRRRYQVAFIAALCLAGVLASGIVVLALRHVLGEVLGGALGLVLITTFVLVRAASFHYVDRLLGAGKLRLNWVLELSGIAIILLSALRADPRRTRATAPQVARR
jgi:hypothetical protein